MRNETEKKIGESWKTVTATHGDSSTPDAPFLTDVLETGLEGTSRRTVKLMTGYRRPRYRRFTGFVQQYNSIIMIRPKGVITIITIHYSLCVRRLSGLIANAATSRDKRSGSASARPEKINQ